MEKLKYLTTNCWQRKIYKTVWVFTNCNCTEQNYYNSPTDTNQLKGTMSRHLRKRDMPRSTTVPVQLLSDSEGYIVAFQPCLRRNHGDILLIRQGLPQGNNARKVFQRCTHFFYCSVLSLGGKVNTKGLSQSAMESIFTT